MRNVLLTIIGLLILTAAVLEFRSTKRILRKTEQIASLTNDRAALQSKYDSLLNAKQKTTIKYDTFRDTIYIIRPRPYKTDTVIDPDTVPQVRNYYAGSVSDSNIHIQYKAKILGLLENLELDYKFRHKQTTVENILYINKFTEVPIWYPKRHLYLIWNVSYVEIEPFTQVEIDYRPNRLALGIEAVYMNKDNLIFKAGYNRNRSTNIYNIGVGLKVF